MIKSLTSKSELGHTLTLTLADPWPSGMFIRNITGLGPVNANINMTNFAALNGGHFNGARVASRNIVIELGYVGVPGRSVEDIRRSAYLNYPVGRYVDLEIETDALGRVKTNGWVEACEPTMFALDSSLSISIICPDPILYSLKEHIVSILHEYQTVNNPGGVDVGFILTVKTDGTNGLDYTDSLTITSVTTNQSIILHLWWIYEDTGIAFGIDDVIEISTVPSDIYARLIHDGEIINILQCFDKDTVWFMLLPGDNTISINNQVPHVRYTAVSIAGVVGKQFISSTDGRPWDFDNYAQDLPQSSWISIASVPESPKALAISNTLNSAAAKAYSESTYWMLQKMGIDALPVFNSVCYGKDMYVAVGTTGHIITAPVVGYPWTLKSVPQSHSWQSICYSEPLGLFIGVGNVNVILSSVDGINWKLTLTTGISGRTWSSVCYGNGLFVAVATTGIGDRIMTSPDGITWTLRTTPANNNWRGVCYGDGLFVAVATSGTGNRVMTSPDGITWTPRSTPADRLWRSVCYGNGLFVAASYTGSNADVMTSSDGITWTLQSTPTGLSLQSVAFTTWISTLSGPILSMSIQTGVMGV